MTVAKKRAATRTRPTKARKPAATAPTSEGQRLLCAVEGSLADIAAELGCSKQLVGYYRKGDRQPSDLHRTELERIYDIPAASWDQLVGGSAKEKATPARLNLPTLAAESTLEGVNKLLTALDKFQAEGALTPSTLLKFADIIGKQLALRARLERDRALLELRIITEHPKWPLIVAAMREAHRPYPDAARAVAVAFAALEIDVTQDTSQGAPR